MREHGLENVVGPLVAKITLLKVIKISSKALWENKDRNLSDVGLKPHGGLNSFGVWKIILNPRQLLRIRCFCWIPFYGLSL